MPPFAGSNPAAPANCAPAGLPRTHADIKLEIAAEDSFVDMRTAGCDFGAIGATAALYQIGQPFGVIDPDTRIFSADGEQRNRGVEVGVFGSPTRGVRLIAGASVIRATLLRNQVIELNGNRAPGVPTFQGNIGGEWDIGFVPGLTLNARVNYFNGADIYAENTVKVPGGTLLSVGARYTGIVGNKPWTVRLNIDNATNNNFWANGGREQLSQVAPRTVLLSLSTDF